MFREHILNQHSPKPRKKSDLPKSLLLTPKAFFSLYTKNDQYRRVSNPDLVRRCGESLSNHVKDGNVRIESIYVERASMLKMDEHTRQFMKIETDEELLSAQPEQLIAERAIIKFVVDGLNDDYRPSLAINLNESGEEIVFGGNVTICDNFTIFGADRQFSSFDFNKGKVKGKKERSQRITTVEQVMQQVEKLYPKTHDLLQDDLAYIEQLEQQEVTREQWNEFVGNYFSRIHYVNRMRLARRITEVSENVKNLPITGQILSSIAAEGYQPSYEAYAWEGNMSNRWKCLNFGTEKTKVEHGISSKTVLDWNSKWTNLILNHEFSNN